MDSAASQNARESLDLVLHISNLLSTGLDRHTLSILVDLCERGVNPEAVAAVVREIRQESSAPPLHHLKDQH
ncbi:Mitotic-spindle organizing protein 1 [Nymphaea thermarum]|nr:Mitotic-spindle organizing protein 1 [Nymphaea thermarum]